MPDLGPMERAVMDTEQYDRVQAMCLCPGCPAYPEEDRGEKKAYCLRGDSAHKESIDPKDCFCESCEVYKHGKLYGRNFFCLEGPGLKQGLQNLAKGEPITDLGRMKSSTRAPLWVSAGLDVHERTE